MFFSFKWLIFLFGLCIRPLQQAQFNNNKKKSVFINPILMIRLVLFLNNTITPRFCLITIKINYLNEQQKKLITIIRK